MTHIFEPDTLNNVLGTFSVYIIPVVLGIAVLGNLLNSKNFEDNLRRHVFSIVVFIPLVITRGDLEFSFWLASAHLLSTVLSHFDEDDEEEEDWENKIPAPAANRKIDLAQKFRLQPAQLVLFSFMAVIFIGTFLLMLPVSSVDGKAIAFMDALFVSTSATCVTGLTTLSIGDNFTLFGQIVILILIQIGGLSIMTLYSSMSILLGRSMGMKHRVMMQDLLDVSSLEDLFAMISDVIKYTFLIELWGAIVLTIAFTFEGFELGQAIYYGFFHSVSAFCNAGFSLFNSSLESYATNPLIHGTIAIQVTLGGLGFIVLKELKEILIERRSFVRLSLHSKIVLITSFVLTVTATLFIFFGEFLGALDNYSLWEKMQISLFQSISLRTAGFSTIPMTNLNTYTLYAFTLFMFIGSSPGGTGGGVKTTTLAILIQSITSTLKGKKSVGMLDRKIPGPLVVKATALTFISILITSFFILLLMKLEPNQSFLTIFFETISASGTVGLTLGITPFLSTMGKLAIAFLMLIGRIGPLTLILAIGQQRESTGKFDYPEGRIMLG
jgi:trk system potassium uptake protein TrkH